MGRSPARRHCLTNNAPFPPGQQLQVIGRKRGNMDAFLIGVLVVGCLVLVGLFAMTAKSKDAGCLPLLLLAVLGIMAVITLARL